MKEKEKKEKEETLRKKGEQLIREDSGKPAKEERKELGKGALARRRGGEEGKRGHQKDSDRQCQYEYGRQM